MRISSLFGLVCVVLLVGVGNFGVAAPPDEAVHGPRSIPQDDIQIAKHRQARLDWNIRTLGEAYEKVGKKNPKWDEKARETMSLAARKFSLMTDPVVLSSQIYEAAKSAIDAGCDDPMIGYLFIRTAEGKNAPGPEETARKIKAAAKALQESNYPNFRKSVALELAGGYSKGSVNPKEARSYYDAALALLSVSVKHDERTEFLEDRWYISANTLIWGYRTVGLDSEAAYKRVDDALAKIPELKQLRFAVRGNFWKHYGWEARTTNFAPKVPEGAFAVFGKRLAKARQACEEGWELKKDGRHIADTMLDIDKGVAGDRENMELWFDRAMKADGDDRDACLTKLDWLDPKWHGTSEELLDFGRQCRDTKNWWAGITLLCADAHHRYGSRLGGEKFREYMAEPEVWADIKAVFDEYLAHRPDDHVARTKYATFAYLAKHFHESYDQFEILGDNVTAWGEAPYYPLERIKGFRDAMTKVKDGKPVPRKNQK